MLTPKRSSPSVASFAAFATLAAMGIAMSATNAEAASHCSLVANIPVRASNTVAHSVAGRSGCSNSVSNVAVAMHHETWRWDDRMASASKSNVRNATWTVVGNPKSGWDIYTRNNSSTGAKSESSDLRWL